MLNKNRPPMPSEILSYTGTPPGAAFGGRLLLHFQTSTLSRQTSVCASAVDIFWSEPPTWGHQKPEGSPRFVPISSDLHFFSGNAPICSDLFVFLRFRLISSSDLLRLKFSEQIRPNQGNPFLPNPPASPQLERSADVDRILRIFLHPKVWPGPSAEMCRGFLLYKFWRILPGIFLEDFSGHFFPQKWGEKIRRLNPRKNPAAQKQKSAKNPVCQDPTLRKWGTFLHILGWFPY